MQRENKDKKARKKVVITGEGVASIAINASYLFAGRWLTIAIRFAYSIILTRYLGPELYGYLNYGIFWYFSFIHLGALGLGVILAREVGRNREHSSKVVNQIFTLKLLVSFSAALICGVMGVLIEEREVVKLLLLVFSFALMGRSLWGWMQAVFTAYEMTSYSLRQDAIFRPLEVILGTIVLFFDGGIIAVACVHGVSWWLQAMRGFFLINRHITKIRLDWSRRILFRFFIIGLPITFSNIFGTWMVNGSVVLYRYFDQIGKNLGQLALAMQIVILLQNILTVGFSASLPLISRSVSREDGKDVLFADAIIRFGFIFGTVIGLAALGNCQWIVEAIFGSQFHEAGYLLSFALWLLIPTLCASALGSVYMARGQYVFPMISNLLGASIFTAFYPWIVGKTGPAGPIISVGIGMSCSILILLVMFAKTSTLSLRRTFLYPFAVTLMTLGVYFTLDTMRVSVWASIPVCYAVFFACIKFFRIIVPSEWSAVADLVKKKLN